LKIHRFALSKNSPFVGYRRLFWCKKPPGAIFNPIWPVLRQEKILEKNLRFSLQNQSTLD